MDERTARVALACWVEPGSVGVAERIEQYGPEAVLAELVDRADQPLVPGRVAPAEVPGLVAHMAGQGVRVVVPGDPEFPTQLLDLSEPPLALWVRGPLDLRAAALRSVAVVGARACTAYGERATAALVGPMAEAGWAVVSGAAFGIDAAAHRAALEVSGPTVAVLACGVDVAYPRAHDALLCRIADSAALVSELPPGSLPLKHRFLARNRLIAALSRGTIVVEAARRSGAIATANRALELGRIVMAVPGPITSMASSGTNRLLLEQSARAVACPEDVTALLLERDPGPAGPTSAAIRPGGSRLPADRADDVVTGLPSGAQELLGALPDRGGSSVEALARRTGLPEASCLALLGLLEVAGLARRVAVGWRRCG